MQRMVDPGIGGASLEAGWSALAEGAWEQARRIFEGAAGGEIPEALEGLGWAGYFLDDPDLTFAARERAYRAYRERGDDASAARVLPGWQRTAWSSVGRPPSPTDGCSERTACSTGSSRGRITDG